MHPYRGVSCASVGESPSDLAPPCPCVASVRTEDGGKSVLSSLPGVGRRVFLRCLSASCAWHFRYMSSLNLTMVLQGPCYPIS